MSGSTQKEQASSSFELLNQSLYLGHASRTYSPEKQSWDDAYLRRLGKIPTLKRNFGFMSILGFSCTVLITWEGALFQCTAALVNGGPAGVLWSFFVCWIGIWSTFATIAELASIAPIASGQYHWIALLSPPSAKDFLSFMTALVTILGWQAITISATYLNASVIQGTITIIDPSYDIKTWVTLLITWAMTIGSSVLNIVSSRFLARFEGVILLAHLLGFFGILIPLVYLGPHGDASVFVTLNDGGDWSSPGLSFLIGLPTLAFSLFGADCAVHMSEEIQNAAMVVPQALVITMAINGSLGFAMMIALMFCIGDVSAAVNAADTVGYSFIEIFQQAVRSNAGAAAMSFFVVAVSIPGTIGAMATSTRLLWAFARDRGAPFSSWLYKLHTTSAIPLNAVATTVMISVLLSLISLGSSSILNDILNLSVAGLFTSYLICCAALLYRRLQGKIREYDHELAVIGPDNLQWGPWRIPEPFGTINNVFACAFLTWTLFWTFWPPDATVTPSNMNYNVLVFGATVLFGIIWYFTKARYIYQGPIIEPM